MNARSRTSLITIAGAALWAALCVAACGAADGVDRGPGTDDMSGTGGMGMSGDVPDPDNTPNGGGANERADAGGANTNTGAGGSANTGAAGSTNTGAAGSAGVGMGSADAGHIGQFSGASCPDNAPMAGFCISFGDQCTYTTSTETHFCTCLASAPATPGTQGWSCR